jgi:DNA-binding transcriptional regulator YiaG
MKKKKFEPLQQRAIQLMRDDPNLSIQEFAERIGKTYSHAGSLMTFARKHLGLTILTKVAKTMAILDQGSEITGREFRNLLGVKNQRASELRHLARKRLEAGQLPSKEALEWLELGTNASQQTCGQKLQSDKPRGKNSKPAVTAQSTATGAMAVQSVQRLPKNPKELIEEAGLSPDEWFVASQIVNRWEIGAKHPDTGEILVEPLFQTKVRLEPIGAAEGIAEALKAYIAELKEAAPGCPMGSFRYSYNEDFE